MTVIYVDFKKTKKEPESITRVYKDRMVIHRGGIPTIIPTIMTMSFTYNKGDDDWYDPDKVS